MWSNLVDPKLDAGIDLLTIVLGYWNKVFPKEDGGKVLRIITNCLPLFGIVLLEVLTNASIQVVWLRKIRG